jgi:putative membrane protein
MSEQKPLTSDELALQRTVMASTRTFMAWTRTALSLISFGFSIPKILEYTEPAKFARLGEWAPKIFGVALIFLGVLVLGASAHEHIKLVRDVRRSHKHMKFSSNRLSYAVALVLTALGILALLNLTLSVGAF